MTTKVRRASGTSKPKAASRRRAVPRSTPAKGAAEEACGVVHEYRNEYGVLLADVRVTVPGLPPLPRATSTQRHLVARRAGTALRAMYEFSLEEALEASGAAYDGAFADDVTHMPPEGPRGTWLVLREEVRHLATLEEQTLDPRLLSVAAILECAVDAYADPYRGQPDDRLEPLAKLAAKLLRKRGRAHSVPASQQSVLESARDAVVSELPRDPNRATVATLSNIATGIIRNVGLQRSALRLVPPEEARRSQDGFNAWWVGLEAMITARLAEAVRRGLPRTKGAAAERLIVTALRAAWPDDVARKAKHVFNFDDRDT